MDALHAFWPYFIALAPSVGVGFLFYVVIKNMIEGDRNERIAHARWEAEHEESSDPENISGPLP